VKLQLRPHQENAVRQALVYAHEHPTGRLLLVIPTRGGKTFVGATLVLLMAIRHGLRALWIANREELLDEAVAHLIDCGIPAGSIGLVKSGRSSDPSAKVQVASDATIDRRDKPLAHVVVSDECHRDTAPRRRRLRRAYPHAFLIGLTATPVPPRYRDLGEDYDELLVIVQPSELIHDGYLAAPTIYAPDPKDAPDLRGLRLTGGDYNAADLEPLLVRETMLDEQVREWSRLSEGRRTVAYPVTIAHSKALAARFRALGIRAEHLDGTTPDRASIIAALRSGKTPVVCSPGVLSEGTNLPEVKCILGVHPTLSLRLYIQENMRGSTPWNDVKPRVLDVVGNVYRHGYPHADRRWALRGETGQILGGVAPLKRCPGCGAIVAVGVRICEACTRPFAAHTPIVPDGPLELREVAPQKREIREEFDKLLAFAKLSAFKDPDQWAADVVAAKYGAESLGGEAA
jgi:superfamily II DNA or RNA helicase